MSDQSVPKHFLDLARSAAAPALTDKGLRTRFGEPTRMTIRPGQVWRACWDDVVVLLVVVSVADREIDAIPITIDPPVEDEHCIVLDGSSTAFEVPLTVWGGLRGSVPTRVLDRILDDWPHLVELLAGGPENDETDLPPGCRRGRPITDEFDPAARRRSELSDDLDTLRVAPGLPVDTPGVRKSLLDIIGTPDLPALGEALDLTQPAVMRLLRGTVPLTTEQMAIIADLTGRSVAEIGDTARPLPLRLVKSAEHPQWRPAWRARAQRLSVSEAEARLSGTYRVFGIAARETGGAEPNWDERLRHFLDETT